MPLAVWLDVSVREGTRVAVWEMLPLGLWEGDGDGDFVGEPVRERLWVWALEKVAVGV